MTMIYYTTADERVGFIAGLRDLAALLESKPYVSAPRYTTTVFVFLSGGSDQERRTEVDIIASQLSTQAYVTPGGHCQASRFFRPVEYRAVAIPAKLLTARKVREFAWRS